MQCLHADFGCKRGGSALFGGALGVGFTGQFPDEGGLASLFVLDSGGGGGLDLVQLCLGSADTIKDLVQLLIGGLVGVQRVGQAFGSGGGGQAVDGGGAVGGGGQAQRRV